MEKSIVETKKAPAAIGPYSQAVKTGSLLFTSGQIAMDPASGEMVCGGIRAQTRRVLVNIMELLEAAGSSMDKVLKTTVFLQDLDDFSLVNEIYAEFFPSGQPARSCVEVSKLPKGAEIEIEVIAHL
jgi:2-iminobutanoate/2-iminopropanoate deaminase